MSMYQALGIVLGMVTAALAAFVLVSILIGLTRDLWQLPMLYRLSPRVTGAVCILIGSFGWLGSVLILGTSHLGGSLFIGVALMGWIAGPVIRRVVWRATPEDRREAAADIRNELAGRLDEQPVVSSRLWPSFVFDLERVRRREAYDPPPI